MTNMCITVLQNLLLLSCVNKFSEVACGPAGLPRNCTPQQNHNTLGKTIVQSLGKTTLQTLGKTTVAKWQTGGAP